MNIGKRIKELRKENKLTQKELADKLNVSTITIQNYENNRRMPNLEMINKIAKALNVRSSELVDDGSIFDGTGKILNYIINNGIPQSVDCRMNKKMILADYIKTFLNDRSIKLNTSEIIEICDFLTPVIDPLLKHKVDEILER